MERVKISNVSIRSVLFPSRSDALDVKIRIMIDAIKNTAAVIPT